MEEDFNFDGSIDNFNFKFKINLNQPSTINSLNIILLFDVQIYVSLTNHKYYKFLNAIIISSSGIVYVRNTRCDIS